MQKEDYFGDWEYRTLVTNDTSGYIYGPRYEDWYDRDGLAEFAEYKPHIIEYDTLGAAVASLNAHFARGFEDGWTRSRLDDRVL